MGEYRQTTLVFVSTLALGALGLTWVAQAQTQSQTSPFARKTSDQSGTQTSTQSSTQSWQSGPNSSGSTTYQYPYGGTTASTAPTPAVSSTSSSTSSGSYPSTYSYDLSGGGNSQTGSSPSGTYTAPSTGSMTYGGSSTPQVYTGGSTPTFSAGTATSRPSSASTQLGTQYSPQNPYQVQSQPSTQAPIQVQASTTAPAASGTYTPGASYDYPSYSRTGSTLPTSSGGAYYPGRANPYGSSAQPAPQLRTSDQARGTYYPQQAQNAPGGSPSPYGAPGQPAQQGWKQKFGLNNIDYYYEGELAVGAAATHLGSTDSWREDFIGDGYILGEVSAITPGGLEYGVAAELRGQYDKYRRGFGGRVGDCPPAVPECSSVNVGGTDLSLRGHTSRFYASGVSDAKDFEVQLEGAHLFLRSAYGDVTVGRDDGAAYLFSLGAPSLLPVGASNSPVDFTGLDAVKTVNDASGFSEKITYTSPRLLGDQIGLGVQIGASYALDSKACGVDYCVRDGADEPAGVLASDIDDVVEFGLALDRKFDNGLSVEATATYARGSQQNNQPVFDDLSALGLGLELGYGDFILGGSYLKSNNGLLDGDYEAMDVGLTWQPSKLGFTLGYGHATDDNVGLTSDQATAGVSYDLNEMFRVSTGVQYVNRDVYVFDPLANVVNGANENATSVFVAGRVKF